jgi:DNA-binding MarR family transcriptional regulator
MKKETEDIKDPLNGSLNYCLWLLMAHTKDKIGILRDRALVRYQVNKEEFAVLYAIQAIEHVLKKEATPSLIMRCLVLSPHAVSQIVTRMQKRGLVEKYSSTSGRKSVTVKATERGLAIWKEASQYRHDIDHIMEHLTKEETHYLWKALVKLRRVALKEAGIVYKPLFPDLLGYHADDAHQY